ELKRLTIEELLDTVRTWSTTSDPYSHSPEGLSREFSALVAEEPNKFAVSAEKFIGLNATYVRGLIDGLRTALKEKRSFDWESVLLLCNWVVNQPRNTVSRVVSHEDDDPDWGW